MGLSFLGAPCFGGSKGKRKGNRLEPSLRGPTLKSHPSRGNGDEELPPRPVTASLQSRCQSSLQRSSWS